MLSISQETLKRLKSVEGTSPRLKRSIINEVKGDILYLKEEINISELRRNAR